MMGPGGCARLQLVENLLLRPPVETSLQMRNISLRMGNLSYENLLVRTYCWEPPGENLLMRTYC